ncbi:leucine-rich repeat neuronal protein 3-like [Achroia grisella]|uniref:leucine-rich repeat neuronal protein 3-like n=1 Tax=Achroia grisella TaxID=688607 RepID=UPI0027D2F80A|nr:leucine-rich repeat neuronal protein 3-like [Achroia grisella]
MINVTGVVVFLVMFCFSASQVDVVENTETPTTEVGELMLTTEAELGAENNIEENWPLTVSLCKKCICENKKVECSDSDSFTLQDGDLEGLIATDVEELNLSGNSLKTLTELPKLSIQTLNLSWCDLSFLDGSPFLKLKNLKYLDLSHNDLPTSAINKISLAGYLEDNFVLPRRFPDITSLNLAYNDIHSLQKDVFIFMMELQSLDLSGNPLGYLDQVTMGAISDLTKLKELRLSGCGLESIPEGLLRRQRRLERLDLSNNKFTSVPTVLSEPVSLLYLNLNRNLISSLNEKSAITSLTELKELHLSGLSMLQSIGAGALGGLPNLNSLYITYNPKLTNIDPSFLMWIEENEEERWPPIKELHLNNNNISHISSNYVDNWRELVAINVSSNPYMCDCSNQWMVDVLVPLVRRIDSDADNDMICKKPPDMRGLTIGYLYDISKRLECLSELTMGNNETSNAGIILGIMIGIFVTFPIVFLIVLLWKRGFFLRCRRRLVRDNDIYDVEETDAF